MRYGLSLAAMLAAAITLAGIGLTARASTARADEGKCYYLNKYTTSDGGTICFNAGKVCVQCKIKV